MSYFLRYDRKLTERIQTIFGNVVEAAFIADQSEHALSNLDVSDYVSPDETICIDRGAIVLQLNNGRRVAIDSPWGCIDRVDDAAIILDPTK